MYSPSCSYHDVPDWLRLILIDKAEKTTRNVSATTELHGLIVLATMLAS